MPSPGEGWRPNTGAPPSCQRVRVVLAHGREPIYDDHWNPMSKPGWAVQTTNWSLRRFAFDVAWYLPL